MEERVNAWNLESIFKQIVNKLPTIDKLGLLNYQIQSQRHRDSYDLLDIMEQEVPNDLYNEALTETNIYCDQHSDVCESISNVSDYPGNVFSEKEYLDAKLKSLSEKDLENLRESIIDLKKDFYNTEDGSDILKLLAEFEFETDRLFQSRRRNKRRSISHRY